MNCYHAAAVMLKNLGVRGLPTLAAGIHPHRDRATRMLELSVQSADALQGHLDDPRAQQM